MSVSDVEVSHVLKVLEPIWYTRTDTARRVRQRIESVLSWATVSGYREGINSAQWKGNLSELLPSANKIRKIQHRRALNWTDVPEFMVNLRKREGMAAKALEFAILTAARSGEVRGMTWDEVDISAKTWTIDSSRMKANSTHIVPLSSVAIKVLKELPRFSDSEFVFPSSNGRMISDMSMLAVCKRMEVDAVPHGFRSSFKDWARSRTNFADEVSELALAHVNNDATRAAYARDKLLPLRVKLMSEWAQFCEMPFVTGNVIAIGAAKHG
jgi:integrase